MADTFRAFFAIPLPEQVTAYLAGLTADLDQHLPTRAVRWVQAERMHLTLRFIGETEKNLLPDLRRALDQAVETHHQFQLHLAGTGCFPNCKRPRVIWAGLAGDVKAAVALKISLDDALAALGWKNEQRPFRPHLTLGRVKNARQIKELKLPAAIEPLPIRVSTPQLIESELTPDGPIYTILHQRVLLPPD